MLIFLIYLIILTDTKSIMAALEVAKAMRDYIDALPTDVVAALPVMPGFDRDWADEVIYEAESASK